MIFFIVIVVIFTIITSVLPEDDNNDHWKEELEEINKRAKENLKENDSDIIKNDFNKQISINEYRIQNNIPPYNNLDTWTFIDNMGGMIVIITIFTVVISGKIVTKEFSDGTIKLLLMRPISRSKILFSKYITSISYGFMLLLLLFIFSFLVGTFFLGIESKAPYIYFRDGQVQEMSMIHHVVLEYLLKSVDILIVGTVAFTLSIIFNSSSLAIVIPIFLMFGSAVLDPFLNEGISQYLLFNNLNLAQYFFGDNHNNEGLANSIIIIILHYILMIALSFYLFRNKEIT